MKSITIIIFCAITIGCTYGQKKGCNFDSADGCMQKTMIIGDPNNKFPVNEQEMDSHCGMLSANEKCVKDYSTKCLDTLARQVTTVLVHSGSKTHKEFCQNTMKRQAFQRIGECANPRKEALDQIMYKFIDNLQASNQAPKTDLKIPLLCCNFKKFRTAVLDETQNDQVPKCTEQVVDEIGRMVDGFASDVLKLICPHEYSLEAEDRCDSILPLTPQLSRTEPRPKSILMPLSNIFKSFKH